MRDDLEPIVIAIPGATPPPEPQWPPAYPGADATADELAAWREESQRWHDAHPDFWTSFGPWGA